VEGHKPWFKDCPHKQRELERSYQAKLATPERYETNEGWRGRPREGPLPNSVGGPTHIQLRDDRSWDDEDIIEEMDTTLDTRRLSAMIPISSGGEERADQVEFREGQITLNKAQRPRPASVPLTMKTRSTVPKKTTRSPLAPISGNGRVTKAIIDSLKEEGARFHGSTVPMPPGRTDRSACVAGMQKTQEDEKRILGGGKEAGTLRHA